jgi:hypothetical protein
MTYAKEESNCNFISLYRAVGENEFYSVMQTGYFSVLEKGAHVKYFGLNFDETLAFANMIINIEVVAIFEVTVITEVLKKIGDFTNVDIFLFKSGTVEIPAEKLVEFNNAIQEIIHRY